MKPRRPREAVSPGLRKLLLVVLFLFAVLVIDSVYLVSITFLQWLLDKNLENSVFQFVFLAHLGLGVAIIVPVLVYSVMHLRRAYWRPNRMAVRLGLWLFAITVLLLVSGILLTRGIPIVEVQDPAIRTALYWMHVIAPLVACWLFVLHRLAGRRIRWSAGIGITLASVVLSLGGVWIAAQQKPAETPQGNFFPSLARTSDGSLIPAQHLMSDDYCAGCHGDIHEQWQYSAHRFASFNNPAYLFSVRNTRRVAMERDGDVMAARFCAGCHDPVPLFSGAFDEPDFDDENHPTAQAGLTCVACHAIESLGSPRGNADYVISAPQHYPFAFSDNAFLGWVNGLLIKGKPSFHKRTFMKDFQREPEFCGTCHKVHLPEELNKYKWLRGQNHYDAFLLSGVSGHGVRSFYYPDRAITTCGECHMPLAASDDLAARTRNEDGLLAIRSHNFAAANTAIPYLLEFPDYVNEEHAAMLRGALRVDIFALHRGDDVDAEMMAPLRPNLPAVIPGETYKLDVVVRNLRVGHLFTEGTADSNEVWLDVTVKNGGRTIGRSGALAPHDRAVDPWSHFVNAYVLDRQGNRIDRRNAEDIFTKLYDHQIPPGATDVVHYRLQIPEQASGEITVSVSLRYRKFDTTYVRAFQGEAFETNDLPIVTIAADEIVLPVGGEAVTVEAPGIPEWQRWNDYGIGFLRKPGRGALRQAEAAFREVSALGRADGAMNLARTFIAEGRLDEAGDALRDAGAQGAYPWSVAWFSGLVDMQNGELDAAIETFGSLIETQFEEARSRGFDFSRDYVLRNKLAQALFERAKIARSDEESSRYLDMAAAHFEEALRLDPENLAAHYGLAQVYSRLSRPDLEAKHRELHNTYRPDNNARDLAIGAARRRDAAANHAAESIVIYDLQRPGAPE